MDAYYLTFQSMTQTQTAAAALQEHGFAATPLRAPKAISVSGCGYAVQLWPSDVYGALFVLRSKGVSPRRVFRIGSNGEAKEEFL